MADNNWNQSMYPENGEAFFFFLVWIKRSVQGWDEMLTSGEKSSA